MYRQLIIPREDVKIAAVFGDGEPAVTIRKKGKGQSVWIGTYPAYGYEQKEEEDTVTKNLLTHWMIPGGYPCIKQVRIPKIQKEKVTLAPFVRLLETEKEYILCAVNHMNKETEIMVKLNHENKTMKLEGAHGMFYRWKKNREA